MVFYKESRGRQHFRRRQPPKAVGSPVSLSTMKSSNCLTHIPFSFICYAFMDDTDLVHTRAGFVLPAIDIIPDMQDAVGYWEQGGLRASEGALVPSKSHLYLVDFKWMNGLWRYCSVADNPGELSMQDHIQAQEFP
jgi:hypothetical protein